MSNIHSIPSQASVNRSDMLEAFSEHLIDVFQMPAERALELINRDLSTNPLTRDMQLQLRPDDGLEIR